ncbi:MAG: transporter substrate-binding domain-containing protein [Candidatus Omnitrophica bacterium]|nr:transporter substrate-binding domain-containing protein [Candidatus Omnitrophota bacterium]
MKLNNTRTICLATLTFFSVILACFILVSNRASGEISLIFAGDIDYAPYSFESRGIPQGYSIDLIRVLAPVIKKNISIKLMPWEKCLEAIKAGKVDGLIGAQVSRKWEKYMDFSNPICEVEYAIFVEEKTGHVDSIKSLEGTAVGIYAGSYVLDRFEKNPRITLIKTDTMLDALHKLQNREITAVIAEKNAALYYIQRDDLRNLRIIAPIADLIYQYSLSVKKGEHALLNDINLGLRILEENRALQRLNRRWFGTYLIKPFRWQTVFAMTAKITGVLLALLILLWVVSLKATIKLKTQQIQRMSSKIIEKEKLAVLGIMAGQIAHELQNPLGTMKNSIYLLRNESSADSKLFLKRLDMLDDKIKLTSNILKSILSYSRVRIEAPSEISAQECLDEVLKDLEIPEGIEVKVVRDRSVPLLVYMDFHQLYSILRNLILNAVQAMYDTGSLVITLFLSDHSHKVNARICDTGPGIMDAAKKSIFDLFYSTKISGTGLGLSISKSIAEANRGMLRLEKTSKKGTCFVLTLPSAKFIKKPPKPVEP